MTEATTMLTAAEQIGVPILSLILATPLAGALLLWTGAAGRSTRAIAIAAASLQLALVLAALLAYRSDQAGLQLTEDHGFYRLGIDGLSVLFLPLTALLTLMCLQVSRPGDWRLADGAGAGSADERRYYAALLAIAGALTGAFAAADIRLFWLFLSVEAIPAWYLVKRYGRDGRNGGVSRDFAVTMVLAAGLSLIGFELLIGHLGGSALHLLADAALPAGTQGTLFVLLVLAFAIRAPLFPLHGWLPRVLEQGPVMGLGVFLVGLKVGTYGFLRFVITPLPEAAATHGWILATLGGAGAIYGGVMALIQSDLRALLAYASVAHMGVIVIGLFSLNAHGIEGGLLLMLTIGMAVAGLYILGAFISMRVSRPDVANMGSLVSRAPLLAGSFLLTALAAVGMPGTSGFNGEHLVVIGAYEAHWVFAAMVGISTVLTAAYLLRFFQRAFMEPARPENRDAAFGDLKGSELGVAGVLAALVLVVGLYTGPFINLTRESVTAVVDRMPGGHGPARQARNDRFETIPNREAN